MEKKKVLLVGEHPLGVSGNSGMMASLIDQLDTEKYEAYCFAFTTKAPIDPLKLATVQFKIPVIPAEEPNNTLGFNKLLSILQRLKFDAVFFIGIDIWTYSGIFSQLQEIRNKTGFKWGAIFPWDLQEIRQDWINWINLLDYPCVYSMYGFDKLKNKCPKLKYFRPLLPQLELWKPFDEDSKLSLRHSLFPHLADDTIIFGSVFVNQHRKDPQGLIKGYAIAKAALRNKIPISLYLHTELNHGVFNLTQYSNDCGLAKGEISAKPEGLIYSREKMPQIYNAIDCLILTSMQEGLSWTPLEAMLCGCPVIASDTTAQTEIVKNGGMLIKCTVPAFMPLQSEKGQTWIDSKKCDPQDIAQGFIDFAQLNIEARNEMRARGLTKAKDWIKDVSNINYFLDYATIGIQTSHKLEKQDRILFIQHSSAGDVLMTTRCFKGLRERHNGLALDYMTSEKYMDIVTNNPYVDQVIKFDDFILQNARSLYSWVYNPHGERILPGCWGRNCNTILSDFYWKILRVKPDSFFIEQKEPDMTDEIHQLIESNLPILVVHSTGGDPAFRTYKYLGDVCRRFKDEYLTVQVGSGQDFPGWAEIDLRGKLTFRETAWVMAQADLSVNVDSFISHLAGALGIPQVVLFGSGNSRVVKPKQIAGRLICLDPDYITDCKGLGPCSASVRDCPAPCTGKHDPKTIIKAIVELENERISA